MGVSPTTTATITTITTTTSSADGPPDRSRLTASMRQPDAPVEEPACVFTSWMRARLQQRPVCDAN